MSTGRRRLVPNQQRDVREHALKHEDYLRELNRYKSVVQDLEGVALKEELLNLASSSSDRAYANIDRLSSSLIGSSSHQGNSSSGQRERGSVSGREEESRNVSFNGSHPVPRSHHPREGSNGSENANGKSEQEQEAVIDSLKRQIEILNEMKKAREMNDDGASKAGETSHTLQSKEDEFERKQRQVAEAELERQREDIRQKERELQREIEREKEMTRQRASGASFNSRPSDSQSRPRSPRTPHTLESGRRLLEAEKEVLRLEREREQGARGSEGHTSSKWRSANRERPLSPSQIRNTSAAGLDPPEVSRITSVGEWEQTQGVRGVSVGEGIKSYVSFLEASLRGLQSSENHRERQRQLETVAVRDVDKVYEDTKREEAHHESQVTFDTNPLFDGLPPPLSLNEPVYKDGGASMMPAHIVAASIQRIRDTHGKDPPKLNDNPITVSPAGSGARLSPAGSRRSLAGSPLLRRSLSPRRSPSRRSPRQQGYAGLSSSFRGTSSGRQFQPGKSVLPESTLRIWNDVKSRQVDSTELDIHPINFDLESVVSRRSGLEASSKLGGGDRSYTGSQRASPALTSTSSDGRSGRGSQPVTPRTDGTSRTDGSNAYDRARSRITSSNTRYGPKDFKHIPDSTMRIWNDLQRKRQQATSS